MKREILLPEHSVLIGLDPGVNTGIAVYIRKNKFLMVCDSNPIYGAIKFLESWKNTEIRNEPMNNGQIVRVCVFLEDARERKWIPRQKNIKAELGRAAGAGSVKRDSQILEEVCIDLNLDYIIVAPKNNKTKMKAEQFNRYTGWKSKSNSHGRDAAWLVFGR